jgi:hypothetical protein
MEYEEPYFRPLFNAHSPLLYGIANTRTIIIGKAVKAVTQLSGLKVSTN